jgi:transposase
MLHHDNAPAHTSLFIREFLAKHEMTVVSQLPYSPDLAPAGFLAKCIPRPILELEKTLAAVYRQWRGVL